ncbi:MAG TPA: alpha/beta family hydrolase [Verrucomicrobiae bacterium]|jgi:dienelactone hydrolase
MLKPLCLSADMGQAGRLPYFVGFWIHMEINEKHDYAGRPREGHDRDTGTQRTGASPLSVVIPAHEVTLAGELAIPGGAAGVAVFAHGSGSSRHSPRNQFVARAIRESGTGTLLFDLLTREEEAADARDGHLRFDIGLLAERLVAATQWMTGQANTRHLGIGYFGASTGGGAALVAAAQLGSVIGAVVSRGGRPDLAGAALARVEAPTLLIVGERDDVVVELNEAAYGQLRCEKEFAIVPRATHLFEEPGTLEEVARLAAAWFRRHLKPR